MKASGKAARLICASKPSTLDSCTKSFFQYRLSIDGRYWDASGSSSL